MRKFALLLVLLLMGSAFGAMAQSLTVEKAKQQGIVGETLSGYLAPIQADRKTLAFVEHINVARQQKYQEIADQNGISLASVAQIAGQKLIARAVSGEYVQGINGQWQRLP